MKYDKERLMQLGGDKQRLIRRDWDEDIDAKEARMKEMRDLGTLLKQASNMYELVHIIHDYVPKIIKEYPHGTQEYDKEYLLTMISDLIDGRNLEKKFEDKGIEGTLRIMEAELEAMPDDPVHPLTREVGGFKLRDFVSSRIAASQDKALDFIRQNASLRGLEDCDSWIDLIWFAERLPKEQYIVTVRNSEGDSAEFRTVKKSDIVQWIKELPYGNADTLSNFPSQHDIPANLSLSNDEDTRLMLDLRKKLENAVQ